MNQYKVISKTSSRTLLEGFTSLEEAQQAALELWCTSLFWCAGVQKVLASELKGSWIQFWEHGAPTWEWVSEWSTLERINFAVPGWCIAVRGAA